jgi:hypothetical protein
MPAWLYRYVYTDREKYGISVLFASMILSGSAVRVRVRVRMRLAMASFAIHVLCVEIGSSVLSRPTRLGAEGCVSMTAEANRCPLLLP